MQDDIKNLAQTLETLRGLLWNVKENTHAGFLAGLSAADGRYADPLSLSRHVAQVYSQSCEDGFIAEIFRRIGTRSRRFLEIGADDGQQNTTRFLLEQGWTGYWIEGAPEKVQAAFAAFAQFVDSGALKIIPVRVTAENVNDMLGAAPEEFDLISVDIDQNTTHIWRALNRKARVSCVEYNASLPPSVAMEVPYQPDKIWNGTNWFGGSLKTMERIGRSKGMNLVGCDPLGINAYFVAADETQDRFRAPFTAEHHYEPPKYNLTRHIGHPASKRAQAWVVEE